MSIPRRTAPSHPALVQHAEDRAQNMQNRIADTITRFAGSMMFLYVHVIWFGAWVFSWRYSSCCKRRGPPPRAGRSSAW